MGSFLKTVSKGVKSLFNWVSEPFGLNKLNKIVSGEGAAFSSEWVSCELAMKQNTVYSCVTIIADNIAQLPVHLYQRVRDGREKADGHPLYRLLHDKPNSWQTPFEFFQYMTVSMLLTGIACAYIGRVGGRIVSLIPIAPDNIQEIWDGDDHWFQIATANGVICCEPREIFCVKAFSLDGRYASSPIEFAAETINGGITASRHNRGLLKNSGTPKGVLVSPNALDEETVEKMRANWTQNYSGGNAGKVAVVWGGLEFKPISMSNTDIQLLETLNFTRTEIAAFFRVPAYMVGAADKASAWGTGMTELKQSFITFTLAPWLVRFQQAITRDLLSDSDRRRYYAEFLTEQFLSANQKERAAVYKVALGSSQGPGWMTVNEVRVKENLPEIEGGDKLYVPITRKGLDHGDGSLDKDTDIDNEPLDRKEAGNE